MGHEAPLGEDPVTLPLAVEQAGVKRATNARPRVSASLRVLLVEDSTSDAALILRALRVAGHDVQSDRVDTARAMHAALERQEWDAVISDWSLPGFSGLEALAISKRVAPELPFIIVSGTIGEEGAVDAMRAGASDFVLKDKPARLAPAIEREMREAERRKANLISRAEAAATLRRTEEQLRQAQKMEALGVLAGGVAHDFNNLLTVILSYSEMLILDLPEGDSMRADVMEIKLAGERATALTRQLLAFSRHQVIDSKIIDLNEVILNMHKMLRRIIREDVELVTCTAPDIGLCENDVGQVEQLVMNLVVNARDAMLGGGTLTIATSNVEVTESDAGRHRGLKAGNYVALSVTDTGTGMSEATQKRIFEPFFTTKEKGKGTGLGLSTVFGVVEQSGGCITVSSELGTGSTFTVYLPRTFKPQAPPKPKASDAVRGTETILLVEDEDQIRAVVSGVLERHGYTVIVCSDGDEAVRQSERHQRPIHLLVTDVVMPKFNGKQLADRLSLTRPEMKVLFMSGYTDGVLVDQLAAGASFLHKPLTPATLTRKVRDVLDGEP